MWCTWAPQSPINIYSCTMMTAVKVFVKCSPSNCKLQLVLCLWCKNSFGEFFLEVSIGSSRTRGLEPQRGTHAHASSTTTGPELIRPRFTPRCSSSAGKPQSASVTTRWCQRTCASKHHAPAQEVKGSDSCRRRTLVKQFSNANANSCNEPAVVLVQVEKQ